MRDGHLLTSASAAPEAMVGSQQHSAWHSPVPYLFGGLAAMLGLIAFALLILACSYWKLSSHLEGGNGGSGVGGDGDAGKPGSAKAAPHLPEHGYVVIMAGDEEPTFLATPTSKTASFGDGNKSKGTEEEEEEKAADDEKRTGEEAAAGDQPNADEADRHPTEEEEEAHDREHHREEAQENHDRRYHLHSPEREH